MSLTVVVEALLVVAVLLVVGQLIGREPVREVMASRIPSEIIVPLVFAADDGDREGRRIPIASWPRDRNWHSQAIGGSRPSSARSARSPGQPRPLLPSPPHLPNLPTNLAPHVTPTGVAGLIVAALSVAILAAAAVSLTPRSVARIRLAVVGAVVLIAGMAILGASRIALPAHALAPVGADAPHPGPGSPAAGTALATMAHDHVMPFPAVTPVSLPAPGTPVTTNGLTLTIAADPARAGPVIVSVELIGPDNAPRTDARVVIFSEMSAMAMGRTETQARETSSGHDVAESVPPGMSGRWRITVNVSPRGQPTQTFAFALPLP